MVVYVYSHYAFASLVAHATAMFPAFFAVSIGLGAPPLVAALALGFFSALNAAMTHYGTGPAPIVFARRLPDASAMVARRLPDLAGPPGDLAADRIPMVEDNRTLVKRKEEGRKEREEDLSMTTYRVAVIPGDGIGHEVIPAAIRVLEAAGKRAGFSSSGSTFLGVPHITSSMAA